MDKVVPSLFLSNDAFREIFQSMSEGIVAVDENGIIVTSNAVAEQIFGYKKNELNNVILENLLPSRYRNRHAHLRTSFNTHPEPRRMGIGRDLTALRKNGTEFPVEISLSYTQTQGKMLVMAFITDISVQKKAEDALRRSEEQLIVYAAELEKKVQIRTDALHKTIERLEIEIHERKKAEKEAQNALVKERELNDLKSKFVTIASHEFRTPLSTILSSISLVDQYKQRNDLDKIDKHTQRVRSSVNHLTGILNDFLSLGKLEEGKIEVVNGSVNIPVLMEDISEEMTPVLKEGQKIILDLKMREALIVSDARLIRNILFNLLSNASKYSEPGKSIYLSCIDNEQNLIIQIRDEGCGIPDDDRKYLFDRFFRASNVSHIEGTGLGLHIVKKYTDLLGGMITYERAYGQGCIFRVSVPINKI